MESGSTRPIGVTHNSPISSIEKLAGVMVPEICSTPLEMEILDCHVISYLDQIPIKGFAQ